MQDFIANIDNLSHKYSKDWAIRNISFNIAKKVFSVFWDPMEPENQLL